MRSARILESSVWRGMPSFAAAPVGPATRPWVAASAASIVARSCSARDRRLKILIRGDYHAHVHRDWMTAADPFDLALLQHPQQRDLRFGRQVADFVEQDGATVRRFESAETSLQRAGKGALLVAEQLRRDERGGDRRAIHADEGAARTARALVDRARDQLLAGASLAEDEDGGICWGDLRDLCQHLAERRRGADDLFEHRGAVDIFAQHQILITDTLFGPLAIIDVGARRVPAQRLTVLIPHRVVLDEEPPVLAIVAPSALLELEGHTTREGVPALLPQARYVFRMKHARAEIGRGHLRDREAGGLEQGPVAVEGLPIRTEDGNRLRNGVDNLLRLLLGRPESFHSSNATPRLPDRNVRRLGPPASMTSVRSRRQPVSVARPLDK